MCVQDDCMTTADLLTSAIVEYGTQKLPAVHHHACCIRSRLRLWHRYVHVTTWSICTEASNLGVASIYGLARQYNSTTGRINDLTSK